MIGSLWEVTAVDTVEGADLVEDFTCDVIVIGAGFTGLRAALSLAEAGSDVVVVDAKDIGWGASGRSGGQVNPMLPVQLPEHLEAAVGSRYADRMTAMSLQSADEVFDLVRKYQIVCDARQHGWLRVDHCAKAQAVARNAARAWNETGAGFEFIDGDELRRLTGSPMYRSAVLAPRGGAVQPLSFVRGLARAAMQAGARIFRNAPVTAMQRNGNVWHLETGGEAGGRKLRAASVILATNGYTDRLYPKLRRSVLPLSPIQIATDELSDEQIAEILPEGHTIADTRRSIMYARREPGNRVVYGGIGYRKPWANIGGGKIDGSDIGGFNWLLADVKRVFPTLANVSWRYRWGGQIAITSDRLPRLHEPEPGLVAGLGYNGRGVAMSIVMGRILAERVLGKALEDLPIPATEIRAIPFRDTQVNGAGLALVWMRLRDAIEFRGA